MPSTPEQLSALADLSEAIERLHQLCDPELHGVVTRYVVVAERQWVDEDGDYRSDVHTLFPDAMSVTEVLGLCEFARARYRAMAAD